jgi:hypothetical protein
MTDTVVVRASSGSIRNVRRYLKQESPKLTEDLLVVLDCSLRERLSLHPVVVTDQIVGQQWFWLVVPAIVAIAVVSGALLETRRSLRPCYAL